MSSRMSITEPQVRPLLRSDIRNIRQMLRDIHMLYPGGRAWVEQRLQDALDGRARCSIATWRNRPIGVTIETPKGKGRIKLSTVFVCESMRGHGVGSALLRRCTHRWLQEDLS